MDDQNQKKFKDSVFDPQALKFCLSVVDFAESLKGQPNILRRAVLDSMSFCKNFEEIANYLTALNSLFQSDQAPQEERFLSVCREVGGTHHEMLLSFLLTTPLIVRLNNETLWENYLRTVLTMTTSHTALADFLSTSRCPTDFPHFQSWNEYFAGLKSLSKSSPETLQNYLRALRHALAYFKKPSSYQGLFRALSEAPQFSEAFAFGQLDSKVWLIDEALRCWGNQWGTVFVLAGWIGVLPRLMFDREIQTTKVRSFDVDSRATSIAEVLNQTEVQKDWHFKAATIDITKLTYPATYTVTRKDQTSCELIDSPDVVINTSCEHLSDLSSWWSQIPRGTRVILQTNDGFHITDHVACFKDLASFDQAMNLSQVHYRGEKALPEFNRFMLIGVK